MPANPRSLAQRRTDTLRRLEADVDCWVATADPASGSPSLVPLSFLWEGASLLLATPATSPTGRNLRTTGSVRVAIGPTRDVVLIEGTVEDLAVEDIPTALGDAFAARAGFDPRAEAGIYRYFRVRPRDIRAWREANELAGRQLMRDGRWLTP